MIPARVLIPVLKFVSLFTAGKGDAREYLKLIEFKVEVDRIVISAANGLILGRCVIPNATQEVLETFYMPESTVKDLLRTYRLPTCKDVYIPDVDILAGRQETSKYPDMSRVIDSTLHRSGEGVRDVYVNPHLVATAMKAIGHVCRAHGPFVYMYFSDKGNPFCIVPGKGMMIDDVSDVAVVVMPGRD